MLLYRNIAQIHSPIESHFGCLFLPQFMLICCVRLLLKRSHSPNHWVSFAFINWLSCRLNAITNMAKSSLERYGYMYSKLISVQFILTRSSWKTINQYTVYRSRTVIALAHLTFQHVQRTRLHHNIKIFTQSHTQRHISSSQFQNIRSTCNYVYT